MIIKIQHHLNQQILLGAVFDKKLRSYSEEEKNKMLSEFNEVYNYLIENDRVFFTGDYSFEGERINDSKWISYFFMCYDPELYGLIKDLEFNNKKELIDKMVNNKAPYRLWSTNALKVELKERKFNTKDFENVDNKNILIELLTQDDFEKSLSKMDKKEEKEVPKKRKKRNSPLNKQLKDKGLWVKGCQYLSSDLKQKLLDAKNEKERREVYNVVNDKINEIANKISNSKTGKDEYSDLTFKDVRKLAIENKDELIKNNLRPRKQDTREQLIDKLKKLDEIKNKDLKNE